MEKQLNANGDSISVRWSSRLLLPKEILLRRSTIVPRRNRNESLTRWSIGKTKTYRQCVQLNEIKNDRKRKRQWKKGTRQRITLSDTTKEIERESHFPFALGSPLRDFVISNSISICNKFHQRRILRQKKFLVRKFSYAPIRKAQCGRIVGGRWASLFQKGIHREMRVKVNIVKTYIRFHVATGPYGADEQRKCPQKYQMDARSIGLSDRQHGIAIIAGEDWSPNRDPFSPHSRQTLIRSPDRVKKEYMYPESIQPASDGQSQALRRSTCPAVSYCSPCHATPSTKKSKE